MTAINEAADLTKDGEVAVLTLNNPPVNALSAPLRDGMAEGIRAGLADNAVKAIVLMCAGRTFIAGADISEFGKPPKGAKKPDPCLPAFHPTRRTLASMFKRWLGPIRSPA